MIKFTNKHNLPQGIYEALTSDTYDGVKDDPSIISVSGLLNPPIVRQLWQRHSQEVEQDAMDMVWSVFGRSVHSVLDNISGLDRIKEERLEVDINGMKLTGKPDIFNISSGIVEDYKVTSVWSLVFAGDGKKEWEQQLNCYAYLLRKKGYQVNGLRIIAILRDFEKRKAKEDENYPQAPIQIINIVDWGEEKQIKYITDRIRLHAEANGRATDAIPVCSPEERWEKPTTWAVYKKGGVRAVKVFSDEAQTHAFIKYSPDAKVLELKERKGVSTRCIGYCPVAKWCPYGSKLLNGGL